MSADDVFRACLKTSEILDTSEYSRSTEDSCISSGSDTNQTSKFLKPNVSTSRPDKSVDGVKNSNLSKTDFKVDMSDLDSSIFELQEASKDVATVSEINEFVLEKIEKFKKRNVTVLQDISPDVKYISNFCSTTDNLKNIANHMKTLSNEGNKLKQILTSDVIKDVWKINKGYHRFFSLDEVNIRIKHLMKFEIRQQGLQLQSVINFFKLLSELVKDFEDLITSLESRKQCNPENSKVIKAKEKKLLAFFEENMDTLKKFDCYVKKYCLNDCL